MPTKHYLLAFCCIILFIISCSDNKDRAEQRPSYIFDRGEQVARIDGHTVFSESFEESYVNHLITTGRNDSPSERYSHLNSLINEYLLAGLADSLGLLGEEFREYRERKKREAVADLYYQKTFIDTLTVPSESMVQRAMINTKIKAYVSQLYFRQADKANAYYKRLESGENFTDLANELYNTATYDSSAGYIGEITYFGVDNHFAEAAFSLKAGEYSEPVRTRLGYYIIKVHNRVANPIITEQEYNRKFEGMFEKTKDRIMKIRGDEYVREYMSGLDIQTDEAAMQQLFNAIQEIDGRLRKEVSGEEFVSDKIQAEPADVEQLAREFNEDRVLLSYSLDGETLPFTVAGYLFWLPEISFSEARSRTQASVGRALRNEVFARLGEQQGLEDDPYVKFMTEEAETRYASWAVKKYLSEQPVGDIPEKDLKAAFYTLGMNGLESAEFSGWVIVKEKLDQIQAIKKEIEAGIKPSAYDGYYSYDKTDLRDLYSIRDYVLKVPLNQITIVGKNNRFYAIYAEDRRTDMRTFEESKTAVRQKIKPFYNQAQTLRRLKKQKEVYVDTTAFESLMDYYDDHSLSGFSR